MSHHYLVSTTVTSILPTLPHECMNFFSLTRVAAPTTAPPGTVVSSTTIT